MNTQIKILCNDLSQQFDKISLERKTLLNNLSSYISQQIKSNKEVNLTYICTHNSRRSHFGQVWAKVAAHYYAIPNIKTFSGGTEATAFNPNAIEALKRDGFSITKSGEENNPTYLVKFGEDNAENSICFSKIYNHKTNPTEDFAAIMTCSDAEENCPYIPGTSLRIGTTYDDPKAFDNTPLQAEKYTERSHQIALECLFVMSQLK